TAAKEGIKEGDWVIIESPRGKVRQRAKLFAGIDPRVVAGQHGWWFPEKKGSQDGWRESNINILTRNDYDNCDPAMGATHIRTLLCKIYPENGRE
ncbi:MAG TPA: molybdopterin dinucleotide binding domain-containing protein, partial [Syntrophorhabdales bacterium]|nr:molybdopterin dinucleotide binding domain-containing protein [Syntrophorhabdales bacterium]